MRTFYFKNLDKQLWIEAILFLFTLIYFSASLIYSISRRKKKSRVGFPRNSKSLWNMKVQKTYFILNFQVTAH